MTNTVTFTFTSVTKYLTVNNQRAACGDPDKGDVWRVACPQVATARKDCEWRNLVCRPTPATPNTATSNFTPCQHLAIPHLLPPFLVTLATPDQRVQSERCEICTMACTGSTVAYHDPLRTFENRRSRTLHAPHESSGSLVRRPILD